MNCREEVSKRIWLVRGGPYGPYLSDDRLWVESPFHAEWFTTEDEAVAVVEEETERIARRMKAHISTDLDLSIWSSGPYVEAKELCLRDWRDDREQASRGYDAGSGDISASVPKPHIG